MESTSLRQDHDHLQRGSVLWLLGPTSAGKTTLGIRTVADLRKRGVPAIFFDGDEVRDWFGAQLGFGADSRLRVVSTLVHLANKAADAGLDVVVAALTAGQDARDYIRRNVRSLTVGYVACSIESCAQRDPKGLYRKAMAGEIDTLIGYNGEYRAPKDPDLVLDTEADSVDQLVMKIVSHWDRGDRKCEVTGPPVEETE